MRVAWFPKTADLAGNPYWALLQQELQTLGVEFETSHSSYWTERRWLLANRRRVQVLHLHFIQPHYIDSTERASLRRVVKFATDLALARLLGYRIVWTVHDLMPTWPKEPRWVEVLARRCIAGLAQDVIVHCHEARRLVASTFHRSRRVWVMAHPSFADSYPDTIEQAQARERLGLPHDGYVVGFVGGIRPNKGLEDLISAFQDVRTANTTLLIAGRPWPPTSYVETIRRLAGADPRIVLRSDEIPDQEIPWYLSAVDVVALPFQRVLTSSSTLLAMSFGRPVIVPRLGCLPELAKPEAGFVYAPGSAAELAAAIETAATADLTAMGAAARRKANAYRWSDLAADTLQVYSTT